MVNSYLYEFAHQTYACTQLITISNCLINSCIIIISLLQASKLHIQHSIHGRDPIDAVAFTKYMYNKEDKNEISV